MRGFDSRAGASLFAFAALTIASFIHQSAAQAQQVSADMRLEERRKENEQEFGLHEKTAEEKQAEVSEVTLEVARVEQTSNQLLRIITTSGAVWDQTIGTRVQPPKPGAVITIKRVMLGGMMCKIAKWTTYRCIRVDRPNSFSTSASEATQVTQRDNLSSIPQPQTAPEKFNAPSAASDRSGDSIEQVDKRSPALPPPASETTAPSNGARASAVQLPMQSTTAASPREYVLSEKTASESTETGSRPQPESRQPVTNAPISSSDTRASSPAASAPKTTQPVEEDHSNIEERRKVNEQNFGLHEKTVEERRAEIDEVILEVARVEQTSNQLLRIITTSGAVWDQTIGAPVLPPKPGTMITIKRVMLGGAMCKLDKWTTYRCIRVDRLN